MSVSSAVLRRLMREISELKTNPPEGIRIVTSDDNILDVTGIIEGPEGTPYAGGYFKVKFRFTEEFPAAPPKCWFATKIFHPNVSSAGEICVNTLKKDWVSSYGISHILVTVKCLLIYPNPESALDEEAGKLLLEDYENYCARAKLITGVHATPKVKPKEFDAPAAESSKAIPPPISISTKTPAATRKSSSPPQAQPLQSNTSNTPSVNPKEKEKDRGRYTSPSPLSTADANVDNNAKLPTVTAASKPVKRSAGVTTTNGEKRKKGLKRL